MSAFYDVIVIFQIYSRFGEIQSWIPDAWSMIFNFALTIRLKETENRTKKVLHCPHAVLESDTIFA